MGKEEREKHIYRLPPCPYYDIEGMESWLESMALEGYILCEDVIADGNRMIHLELRLFSENSKNIDEWMQIFAQKFVR